MSTQPSGTVARPWRTLVLRNALVYRRNWRQGAFFSFLQPTMFLAALGLGLGSFIDRGGSGLGVSYLAFLAPGMLAAIAMQSATFEATFPILRKLEWERNYEAILATPFRVVDLLVAEIVWIILRMAMVAGSFLIVMYVFGVARHGRALLALPAAILTGMAFAIPIIAFTANRAKVASFNPLFRFFIMPMFLFSGTFFPIERLPSLVRPLAYATPLYHGVSLTRGLVLDSLTGPAALLHSGVLLLITGASIFIAKRELNKRLVK